MMNWTCEDQYGLSLYPSGEPYEFVPVEWLKKWLDDSTAIKEIDNSHFLCSHGKLHPDRLNEAKRISHSAAQILFSRYGGGPRIDGNNIQSFCSCILDLLVRTSLCDYI